MMWYGTGMNGWGFALMTLSNIAFWVVVAYGLVALVRHLNRAPHREHSQRPAPEEVLADRYARGEIDDEEYQRRLAILRDSTGRLASS